jgi:tetratricopeptide (TPR) repeat protein
MGFRHALLREAAYEMFVPEDRVLGHRLAGYWLAQAGEGEAVVLAEHFERGGARRAAVAWYRRAAEQALEGNDLAAAVARAARGIACGAEGEVKGALLLLQAEAELWRGDNAAAAGLGVLAMAELPRGGPDFCRAAGQAAAASGRLGDAARMDGLGAELLALAKEGAQDGAFAIACARTAMSWLLLGQRDKAVLLLDVLDRIAPAQGSGEPLALAWIARAGALDAYLGGDLGGYLAQSEAVAARFEEAGDRRVAALQRVNVGYANLELGAFLEAEAALRDSCAQAGALGLGIVQANAQHNLGMALGRLGRVDEAIAVESEAERAFHAQGDRRLEAGSRMYLAILRALGGDLAGAERDARAVIAMAAPSLSAVHGHALAVLADVLLTTGRAEEAAAAAAEAMTFVASGALDAGEALARVTFAEARHALGDLEGARSAVAAAREGVLAKADKIRDPARRESFLRLVPEHARILARAAEWQA